MANNDKKADFDRDAFVAAVTGRQSPNPTPEPKPTSDLPPASQSSDTQPEMDELTGDERNMEEPETGTCVPIPALANDCDFKFVGILIQLSQPGGLPPTVV